MRVAALDLGSNTSLLLIAELDEGARITRVLHDETNVTRLGQGVHASRRFHADALARMNVCLAGYARRIRELACEKVIAVATSAARDVTNGAALLELGRAHGIPIHIISGDREARLTFHGALCDRVSTSGIAVIDVGGGSTEVITGAADGTCGTSVDVGSVRLTERFVTGHPIPAADLDRMRDCARQAFAAAPLPRAGFREAVAVAGTPTTLTMLELKSEFSEALVHGHVLTVETVESWAARLAQMSVAERERLPGMQPKRADVIVAGAEILAAAIRALGMERVTVSTRGVRYGVALAWREF